MGNRENESETNTEEREKEVEDVGEKERRDSGREDGVRERVCEKGR